MARFAPLRDVRAAISLLTVVPAGPAEWTDDPRPDVAAWFPLVGAGIGALGWGVLLLADALGWRGSAPLVLGGIVVAGWALMTRLLHWDGLADIADGLWGGATPARRLEIMSDSSVGAFGATAVALVAIVQVASVGALATGYAGAALVAACAAGRGAATAAAWLGSPARSGGLGRSIMGRPHAASLLLVVAAIAAVGTLLVWEYGVTGAALGVMAFILALGVPHVLSKPVGGVTGDVMGASVIVVETVVLAAAALLWGS